MRHKHVLFLIPSLRGGGAERVITTLLQHLDRSSFKLTLALVDARESVFLNEVPADVEFIDLRCRRVRYALPKIVRADLEAAAGRGLLDVGAFQPGPGHASAIVAATPTLHCAGNKRR